MTVAWRADVVDVSDRLVREFAPALPAGSVMRCVASCSRLLRASGVRAGLPDAVEAMARQRLAARTGGLRRAS